VRHHLGSGVAAMSYATNDWASCEECGLPIDNNEEAEKASYEECELCTTCRDWLKSNEAKELHSDKT